MKKAGVVIAVFSLIFILSLSLVSASWFSDIWNKITGKTVSNPTNIKTCVDSDGGEVSIATKFTSAGDNQFVKGMVSTKEQEYNDYCFNRYKMLKEHYCDSKNNLKVKSYKCKNGCKDGACISNLTCTDSDGGLNYYVKGYLNTTISPGTNFEDYCLNNTDLIERHCLSPNPNNFTVQYSCPNGCQDGACIPIPNQTCVNECGNGICQEIVCFEAGCPCEETIDSCPQDCGNQTIISRR